MTSVLFLHKLQTPTPALAPCCSNRQAQAFPRSLHLMLAAVLPVSDCCLLSSSKGSSLPFFQVNLYSLLLAFSFSLCPCSMDRHFLSLLFWSWASIYPRSYHSSPMAGTRMSVCSTVLRELRTDVCAGMRGFSQMSADTSHSTQPPGISTQLEKKPTIYRV